MSLNTLSRLKGIETLSHRRRSDHHQDPLNTLSRLKGIETQRRDDSQLYYTEL